MTAADRILGLIAEWRRGCSCDGTIEDDPNAYPGRCRECTVAFVAAIERCAVDVHPFAGGPLTGSLCELLEQHDLTVSRQPLPDGTGVTTHLVATLRDHPAIKFGFSSVGAAGLQYSRLPAQALALAECVARVGYELRSAAAIRDHGDNAKWLGYGLSPEPHPVDAMLHLLSDADREALGPEAIARLRQSCDEPVSSPGSRADPATPPTPGPAED